MIFGEDGAPEAGPSGDEPSPPPPSKAGNRRAKLKVIK
jgi:hypothetical protein